MSGAQNKSPKTQMLKENNKKDDYIKLDVRKIDQVDSFIYLGSVINVAGGTDEDIKRRINLT